MAAILDIRKGVYPHNEEFLQCLGIIRNTLRNDVWGTLRSSYFLRQPFNICLIRMKLRYWKLTWLCCRSFASKGVFWAIPVNSKSFQIAQKQPLRKIGRQYTAGIQGKIIQKFYLGFIVWVRSPEWSKATSFLGGSGDMPPGNFLKWICAEMQSSAFWDTIASLYSEYLLHVHWLARRVWMSFPLRLLMYCNENNMFWGKLLPLKYPR